MTQAELMRRLRHTAAPEQQRDLALELLGMTRSREAVELALRTLARDAVCARLDASHRPVLREKAAYYFEHNSKDRGGSMRAAILRLLARIGHPADSDLYRQGVLTYEPQPVTDVAQNLRAAALVGLAAADPDAGSLHATRLLGEADTSRLNGEPALTALAVLAQGGHSLPIYQFLLQQGEDFLREGMGEVTARAIELVLPGLPPELAIPLATQFAALDSPEASSGLIQAIIQHRIDALQPVLEDILTGTRHDDVHRFGVIALAASRHPPYIDLLLRLAERARRSQVANIIEALELITHERRDALIERLRGRQ